MDKYVYLVFAKPEQQVTLSIPFVEGDSVQQLIQNSGILEQCPDIDLTKMAVGVFGKVCRLGDRVNAGDRVEIYRPLLQTPMDARRNRAIKN